MAQNTFLPPFATMLTLPEILIYTTTFFFLMALFLIMTLFVILVWFVIQEGLQWWSCRN